MSNNVEVELRALISDERPLQKLYTARDHVGATVIRQNRFLIDYSTFLEGIAERTRDIRVRVTNGHCEIIAKEGAFGDTSRRESSIEVSAPLREVLTTMAYMGFRKGVAAIRVIERFSIDGIEFAIQEVRDYKNPSSVFRRFVEAEILTNDAGRDSAIKQIRSSFEKYGFREIPPDEWYEFIAFLNQNANGVFDFDRPNWDVIASLGL